MNHGGRFMEALVRSGVLLSAFLLQSVAEILMAFDRLMASRDEARLRESRQGASFSKRGYISGSSLRLRSQQLKEAISEAGLPAAPVKVAAVRSTPVMSERIVDPSAPVRLRQTDPMSASAAVRLHQTAAQTASRRGEILPPRPIMQDSGYASAAGVLSRVNELLNDRQAPPDRVRILCIAQEMMLEMQTNASTMGLPDKIVQPFYAWVYELYNQWKVKMPVSQNKQAMSLEAILRYVETHRPDPVLDVALLDEGQELPPEAYRLLALVSKHVTIFTDQGRRLYDCF